SGRIVEIPHAVMHRLEMPDSFAGTRIQADDALTEQVVARSVPAIEIIGGRLCGQIDVAQLQVGAHHRPDAGVASDLPGTLLPGVIPELTLQRNGVEGPRHFPGADVIATNPQRWPLLVARPVGGNL